MKEELNHLLYLYSSKYCFADKKFFEAVVSIVAYHQKLNDFVNTVTIKERILHDDISHYLPEYKIIEFSSLRVTNVMEEHQKRKEFFSKIEYYFLMNSFIMQLILHELEHVFQEKVLLEQEFDSLEKRIIKISDHLAFLYPYDIYISNHMYIPNERLAELKSYHLVNSILNGYSQISPKALYYLMAYERIAQFTPYSGLQLPSECVLKKFLALYHQESMASNFPIYSKDKEEKIRKMPLEERLLYGLQIMKEEYHDLENGARTLFKNILK